MGIPFAWKRRVRRGLEAAVVGMFPGGPSLGAVLARVDGHLYPHEAVLLHELARFGSGEGDVVEIGSFLGRSTLCLATGLDRRGEGRVIAVDPHVNRTESALRANLARFAAGRRVEVRVATSAACAEHWHGPVRLLFIDGDHAEAAVRADVEHWLPHVVPGGFVLFHDATDLSEYTGPRTVARPLLADRDTFDLAGALGSIRWGRRRGGADPYRPTERGRMLDGLIRRWKAAGR